VENALDWLWERREGNRLSGRKYMGQGGLAGILSGSADNLLRGLDHKRRERALELLFSLVKVDSESRQHTRRRDPDGGGRAGPLRLITVTEEATGAERSRQSHRWVNLIHETLIRSKGLDEKGK